MIAVEVESELEKEIAVGVLALDRDCRRPFRSNYSLFASESLSTGKEREFQKIEMDWIRNGCSTRCAAGPRDTVRSGRGAGMVEGYRVMRKREGKRRNKDVGPRIEGRC